MAADRRRLLIRAIAAQPPVHVTVRRSTGASCALCLDDIAPGTRQYEIDIGRSTVIVDERCYDSSLRDIIGVDPTIEDV
jgi:hypothetical protein